MPTDKPQQEWTDLADVMEEFVDYCKSIPRADSFNVLMIETVLGNFSNFLRAKAEGYKSKDGQPKDAA